MIKPTRYEYEAPTRIQGSPSTSNTKLDISQSGNTWIATLHISTTPCDSDALARARLREELQTMIAELGGAK